MELSLLAERSAALLGMKRSSLALHPLKGGGNNRLYRVESSCGIYALKEYFNHSEDTRDRLGSEWKFLKYAWKAGIHNIPKPIAYSNDDHLGLYSFIDGYPMHAEEINRDHIKQAALFVKGLNSHSEKTDKKELPLASEACLSVREHFETIERRVRRLLSIPCLSAIDKDASVFIQKNMLPAWDQFRDSSFQLLKQRYHGDIDTVIHQSEQCVSPSDFGFHNALKNSEGILFFLDFEYAGIDDPAKLVCDYFNQVAVPVSLAFSDEFESGFKQAESCDGNINVRIKALLPLYCIKWCCIILNNFLPVDGERRHFAKSREDIQDQKRIQLVKAQNKLSTIRSMEWPT
jgi:hypothetical protein